MADFTEIAPYFKRLQDRRPLIAQGFNILAGQPDEVLDAVAAHLGTVLDPSYPSPSVDEASKTMRLQPEAFQPVGAAVSCLVGGLYGSPPIPLARADVLLDGATEAGFLDPDDRGGVTRFVREHLASHDDSVSVAVTRERSADFVLPRFKKLNVTTDVRVTSSGEKLVALPVAVVILETDVPAQQLLFQMPLRDVERLQQTLVTVAKKLTNLRSQVQVNSEASDGPN